MALVHSVRKIGKRYRASLQPLVLIDSTCTFDKVQARSIWRLFSVADLYVWHPLLTDSFFEWLEAAKKMEGDYRPISNTTDRFFFRNYRVQGPIFARLEEAISWVDRVGGFLVTQNPIVIDKADQYRVTTPLAALHHIKENRRM